MLRFRILGPVEVWAGERPVALGGPRQVSLLAFLLLNANRAVSGDAVIDAVWGSAPAGADKRLQMAITRLRRSIAPSSGAGEPTLRTVGGGYLLAVAPEQVDAEVFAEQVRDGRRALADGDPARASEVLSQALGLWRGPPLAGVAFEEFAQAEIRRLEELRLCALETRIDADLQLGRHPELTGELEALVAEHPTREHIAAQLMLALYRAGRQVEALEVYQRARAYLAQELGLEPGPTLKAVQAQILEQSPSIQRADRIQAAARAPLVQVESGGGATDAPVGAAPPLPQTPTIGREHEVKAVLRLLSESEVRLVTLTGPGGVGKTRLALEIARRSATRDSVCWVELAGVARAENVPSAMAHALSVTPLPGESASEALRRELSTKQCLLVIDNFEHVLDATGLVSELHAACPGLAILTTSREALNLAAEHRVRVEPLEVPANADLVTASEIASVAASALFIAAARRRDRRLPVNASTAPTIARICQCLDGLPLALELAAARTVVLGLGELAARLEESVADLGPAARDAPARQRTLTATIDWSYELLSEAERAALVRFAVFAGGGTLESAQAVTCSTLDTLEALIDKSFLDRRSQEDGAARLMMLETVRAYALQRLDEARGHDAVRRRHLAHYLHLAEQANPRLGTHTERDALVVLDAESDNFAAALGWALGAAPNGALRLAGQLAPYWRIRGDSNTLMWLDAVLQAAGERAAAQDRACAQLYRSFQLMSLQRHAQAAEAAEEAVALYTQAGDERGMSRAFRAVTAHAASMGQNDLARACMQSACAHARASGDDGLLGAAMGALVPWLPVDERRETLQQASELLIKVGDYRQLAQAYNGAAYHSLIEGRTDEAMSLVEGGLRAIEGVEDARAVAFLSGNLGLARLFRGEILLAREAFERQLELCRGHQFLYPAAEGLAGLAAVAAEEGQLDRAARLQGLSRAMGYPPAGDRAIADRLESNYLQPARARYDPLAWRQAEDAGAAFTLDQAIAYALDRSERGSSLVAPGQTNNMSSDPGYKLDA